MVGVRDAVEALRHRYPRTTETEEHREPGSRKAYGAEDNVYVIPSEDEVENNSDIEPHRVTRRTKRLQDTASSATDPRMASGSVRQPVPIRPTDPTQNSSTVTNGTERRAESTRPRPRQSASGMNSPYNAVGRDTLNNGPLGTAERRSAYAKSQQQSGPSRPSFASNGTGASAGPSKVTIRHNASIPSQLPAKEIAPVDYYGNERSSAGSRAGPSKPRQTAPYDPDQPTLSFPKQSKTMNIKGNAAASAAIEKGGKKSAPVNIKGRADRKSSINTIDIDDSDDERAKAAGEEVESIERFSDDEEPRSSRTKPPATEKNSAQKVIAQGHVDRGKRMFGAQPNDTHARPPANPDNDSEDDMHYVGTQTKGRPQQHSRMQSRHFAQSVDAQSRVNVKTVTEKGKGKARPKGLQSLPLAAFQYKTHKVSPLEMVLHPHEAGPSAYTVKFAHRNLHNLFFKLDNVYSATCHAGGSRFMIFTLRSDGAGLVSIQEELPGMYLEFDELDWTNASTAYNDLLAGLESCGAKVSYVPWETFVAIRDSEYPIRESRSRPQTQAAEAAEKRRQEQLQAASQVPSTSASGPPRVRPRPTAAAQAAENRFRTEGRSNGPTAAFAARSRDPSTESSAAGTSKGKTTRLRALSSSSAEAVVVGAAPKRERMKGQERKGALRATSEQPPSDSDKGKGKGKARAKVKDRLFEDLPRIENAFERFFPEDKTALVYPFDATGSVTITNGDLNRLAPGEYLNDTLIEYGMKRLCADLEASNNELFQQVHVFSSFFYKKLTEKEGRNKGNPYESVKKWTSKFNLFRKKYILLPINENFHWYLAIIVNPGWVIDPRAAERKAHEIKRNQSRKSKQTARKSTGPRKKRTIEQSDDENHGSDGKAGKDSLRRASQSLSSDPPSVPSRDLSSAALSEDEVQASDKPDSKNGSVSAEGSKIQRMPDNADESTKNKMADSAASEKMDIDIPIAATAEIAGNTAMQVSPNDRCYIITFDSLGGSHSSVYSTLKNYLKCEAKDKLNLEDDAVHIDKENCKGSSAKVPEQPNGCDCGLYVLHFADMFLRKAADIMQCFEKEKRLTQTQDEVDTMWDSVRALQGRTKLLEDICNMSEKWQAFVIDRDVKQKEAREARRKAKAAKAARASDTEMQDADAAMSGVPESESSSGSEESADDDVQMVSVNRASPRKRTIAKEARQSSRQGENDDSQSTIKASAASVRSNSPGFTVTTHRAGSPDADKRQKPPSHRAEIPSSTTKKGLFVGVEVASKRSAGSTVPRATPQAHEKPEKAVPTPLTVRDMDFDQSPPVDDATVHINGQTDKAADAAEIEESEEYSTGSSNSGDSGPSNARLAPAEHAMRGQFVQSNTNTNTKGLAQELGRMHVEKRQEAVSGCRLDSSVPLTDHNSRPQRPEEGDDSFAFRTMTGHHSLANLPDEHLLADMQKQVEAGDGSSQQSVDFERLRTDPRKYKTPINHGDQPLPESPARQGPSYMHSSPRSLIGDEITVSPNISDMPGTSQAATSNQGDDVGPSKRKRHSSTIASPSHSQEGSHQHKAKKPRSVPSLGAAQVPTSKDGQKLTKLPNTNQIIEITDDDPETSTELATGDGAGKAGFEESSNPPFPPQYVGRGSSASQSPKQKHRERPTQSGHRPSGSRSLHF